MRKLMKVLGMAMVLTAILVVALAGTVFAANGHMEPAPESGDCIPNGSGFTSDVGAGVGPAPNSGDGIPDGSGF